MSTFEPNRRQEMDVRVPGDAVAPESDEEYETPMVTDLGSFAELTQGPTASRMADMTGMSAA
jgi:hypothetical protein